MSKINEIAREYIDCKNKKKILILQKQLDACPKNKWGQIVKSLQPQLPKSPPKGNQLAKPFNNKNFLKKFPESRLYTIVPETYSHRKKWGVLIFLHGGAKGTANNAPECYLGEEYGLVQVFKNSGRIVCMPSAPPSEVSDSRWSLRESDDYLCSVIDELMMSYNIDPDNIILAGTSMGGCGAIHYAFRFADRFASVLASAHAWPLAYWPCLTGMPFWQFQGANDCVLYKRYPWTDVEFARFAKARLDLAGVENYYFEHSGRHHIGDGLPIFKKWLRWCENNRIRRDPYAKHIVVVTPRGLPDEINPELAPAPHSRWISIDEIRDETIIFDRLDRSEFNKTKRKDWDKFKLHLSREHIHGGIVEAEIDEDGVFEITPVNVKKFTLWLHPKMTDLKKVKVNVRGVEKFSGKVKPSLGTLLESYRRRRDWGMLYPAKLSFEDKTGEWKQKDQLKLKIK